MQKNTLIILQWKNILRLPPKKTQTLKKNINHLTMLKVFEVKFTKHKINHFKATKSRYYTFTMRYNHHLCLVRKHHMTFKETAMSFKQLPHSPHSLQSLESTSPFFLHELTFSGYFTQHHTCDLLYLASFTQPAAFEVHPSCSQHQCFTPFHG